MLVPNKTLSLEETVLYKACLLKPSLGHDIHVIELFENEKKKFADVSEFVFALDMLFVLGKIELNEETGEIINA